MSYNTRSRKRVNNDDSSTPQTGTPSNTRIANIPRQAIEKAAKSLRKNVNPEDDEEEIRDSLNYVWTGVHDALEQDPELKEHLANRDVFRANVKRKGEKIFIDSLRAMATNSDSLGSEAWEGLFNDEVFLKEKPAPSVSPLPKDTMTYEQKITQLAWTGKFQGRAAEVLLETISSYLDKKEGHYSRQATIVNSSGTGKSRMVDELATKIIIIPMCLRSEKSTGYPRPDATLRNWLLSGEISDATLGTIRNRLHGFVYALLTVTRTTLESLESGSENDKMTKAEDVKHRQAKLASTFRDLMTEGQSYQGPNNYRKTFYNKVMQLAEEFMKSSTQIPDPFEPGQPEELRPYVSENQDGIRNAGGKLAQFVDPDNLLDSVEKKPRWPLVILSFDEAHILTDNPSMTNRATKWNLFSELRRIIRQTSPHAIFSLFLSTAGRFNLFSPEISSDPSLRIQNSSLSTLDPITEISFDDLAYYAPEYKIILNNVVEIKWMCHLGRPLFASMYDAAPNMYRDESELLDLVKAKLLDGPTTLGENRSGSLACLSVRFALEFNMDGTAGDIVRTQVERHMRLCLAATAGRDTMVTLAGSEPLLAEAAYELMKATQSNPVRHLANHSDLNCVDRGRRGELVAALLIMRACDAARAASPSHRWVRVETFMQELLPQTMSDHLKESFPTFCREGEDKKFATTFKDYGIWFNHVIKVENSKMISVHHLWKFITRGAMILCSNNQEGIDIVIPMCHMRQPLSRHSVTAILVQVKNADRYQFKIDKSLFDGIDPIKLDLFPDKVPAKSDLFPDEKKSKPVIPKPVIRIVFALASSKVGVDFPLEPERERHFYDKFTAFDVWCAGLGDEAFKHTDDDLAWYRLLLERSLRPHDAFELQGEEGHDETKQLRGTLRRRMAPLTTTDDVAHHRIHVGKSAV